MSNWEETLWQTQDTLERLNLLAGLRMPWDLPPGGAGESGCGKECLGFSQSEVIQDCCLHEPDQDEQLQDKDDYKEENTAMHTAIEW